MKINIIFVILFLLMPLSTWASNNSVNEVNSTLNNFVTNWNEGNMNNAMQVYNKSASTILVSDNVIKGYENIVSFFHTNYPTKEQMGKISFSDVDIKVLSPKYTVVVGKWSLMRETGGNAGGIFTALYEKTSDGWKIILDHTTGL